MGSRALALVGHAQGHPARDAREQAEHGRRGTGVPLIKIGARPLSHRLPVGAKFWYPLAFASPSMRPFRLPRALGSLLVVLLVASGTAWSAGGDAGSGTDAGATFATGLPVPYGSYTGRLSPADGDWYRAPGVGSPACLEAALSPSGNPVSMTLGFERNGATRLVNQVAPNGTTTRMGVAGFGWTTGAFGVETSSNKNDNGQTSRPTDYAFNLQAVTFSSRSSADALTGGDAGASLEKALPVTPGCVAGHLDPIGPTLADNADAYRVEVPAGSFVTFSLATPSGAPLDLQIYDAQGTLLTTVAPDGLASFSTGGVYYASATRSAVGVEYVPYLIGIVVGPPDPGQGCRPACV